MIHTILCVLALSSGELIKQDLQSTEILDSMRACEVLSDNTNGVSREWIEFIKEN